MRDSKDEIALVFLNVNVFLYIVRKYTTPINGNRMGKKYDDIIIRNIGNWYNPNTGLVLKLTENTPTLTPNIYKSKGVMRSQ